MMRLDTTLLSARLARSETPETTITWAAGEEAAILWTAQRSIITRLRKIRGAARLETHRTETGIWTGETWRVPVKSVLPRNVATNAPPRPTKEQRQRNTARLLAARKRLATGRESDHSGLSSDRRPDPGWAPLAAGSAS
jgi:hypothetical protein